MATRERCAAPGCGRFAGTGRIFCGRHEANAAGADRDDAREEGAAAASARQMGALFQDRLARGEYRALFDPRIGEVIAQAAAERGLGDEIGALRFVLARLLADAAGLADPTKLAASVARVTAVAVQAARAQRALSADAAGLAAMLERVLADLDADTS